jgi:hypothetical protein
VSVSPVSLPSTFVAKPWIADHEFPQRPDSVADASLLTLEVCALADLTNADGAEVTLDRHRRELGLGDGALEP